MNEKTRENIIKFTFWTGIILFLLYFFIQLHPLVVYDSDDWSYIGTIRSAYPTWGAWNPAKIFPEVFMSLAARFGIAAFYHFNDSYVTSMAMGHAVILVVFMIIYFCLFDEFVRRKLNLSHFQSKLATVFFFICHFLIFKSGRSMNQCLFSAVDVNWYYNYVIPDILNIITIFLIDKWIVNDKEKSEEKSIIKLSFLCLTIYLSIFSNMFQSIILMMYVSFILLNYLIKWIKNKKLEFDKTVYICIYTTILWIILLIFERNGTRAASVSGDTDIFFAFQLFLEWIYRLNRMFILIAFIITVIALVIAFRRKEIKNKLINIVFIAFALIFSSIYTILLSGISVPTHITNACVIYTVVVWGVLFMSFEVAYILKNVKVANIAAVTILFIMMIEAMSGERVYRTIEEEIPTRVKQQVTEDIIQQFIEADNKHLTEMVLEVPDYGSDMNWPLMDTEFGAGLISDSIYNLGITGNYIEINIVKNPKLNNQYGL